MDQKHRIGLEIDRNSLVSEGDGVIRFNNGLTITDTSEQKNGTSYNIDTLDLDSWNKNVYADHDDRVVNIVGEVIGSAKRGSRALVEGVRFAVKESATARLVHDLVLGGFAKDVSIGTFGPPADENGVFHNAKVVELSFVGIGNNDNATLYQAARNSISEAQKEGLDTKEAESLFPTRVENKVEATSTSPDPVVVNVTINNVQPDKPKEELTVENKETPVVEEPKVETPVAPTEEPKTPVLDQNAFLSQIKELVDGAVKPLADKVGALEQNAFDAKAVVPEWKPAVNAARPAASAETDLTKYENMSSRERHGLQINAAWDLLKRNDHKAGEVLNKINEVNLSELKKGGKVDNSLTIADFGNFVISRELLTDIVGCRNDYTALVNATEWKETLSTQFAWLKRSGDINMQSVEFCDDNANGNLKPISEYAATIETSDLEELAAVTPVCNAATRFLAADLLGDVAAGYRNDYDRKRAQLVIARLEQAIEENGNSVIYDTNPSVNSLTSWVDVWAEIATCTPNGTFLFSTKTYAEIMRRAVQNGVSGPLANIFITGQVPTIFGRPFIVLPDDLLPALDTAQTKTFAVDGTNVTVNHAVFYANLSNFTGRTSGGLQYDLSTEAAYEDNGTVKSAYQRNELVLRGSFFRGGAIKDTDQVAALASPGVS